jgi:CubicO group peptidase (beta-lactamase class C family)
VTLANWQDPPFNRWAFQHVRELIPTVRISGGSGPPWRLPSDDRDIAEVRFRHDDRELSIADLLADTYTDGFLVVHHGRIVTEQYFNGLAPDVPHLLMSVSKSVTSAVAGILVDRRLLDPSAPVTGIVAALHGTSFEGPRSSTCWTCGRARGSTRATTIPKRTCALTSAFTCGGQMTARRASMTP